MSPQSPDQPFRALIYCRASADPTGRGLSVGSQESENREWCAREGWEVAGVLVDNDRSASRYATKEREGYDQVKRALSGEVFGRIDILVYWESSRGTRDLETYVPLRGLCADYNVLLAYRGKTHDMNTGDGRFTTGLDVLVDERYADEARDRTLRGHRTSVANRTPRGYAMYGFLYTYNPHTGRLVGQERDPETAPVIEEIARRIIAGQSLYAITAWLNDNGIPTARQRMDRRKGREVERAGWSSSMIRNLMGRHALKGVRSHNGQAVGPGTWQPIISPADWEQVQTILGERRISGHDTRVRALLSGIATCGVCTAWLRPMTNRGRATYVCAGLNHTSSKGHVSRGQAALDSHVVLYVVERLRDPRLLADVAKRRRGEQERVDDTESRLADLQAELAEYVRSAASRKGVARAAFEQVADQIAAQIEALEAERKQTAALPAIVTDLAGPNAEMAWDAMEGDLASQRQVIRSLVRVVVHRSTTPPGSRRFDPSSIRITPR